MTQSPEKLVAFIQKGVWDMERESMPLAAGYLTAMIAADPLLSRSYRSKIHNFRGSSGIMEMIRKILFEGDVPDVLAFSVLGWNYNDFCKVAETAKQLQKDILVVFGGNHVAFQGQRVLMECPYVDIVVNGEGEFTMKDILAKFQFGENAKSWFDIQGISFKDCDKVITTPPRARIDNLDEIPSPLLSGAIELTDDKGNHKFDVVLLETSRGCPYSCSFCYWGGAVGQKMRTFSMERISAELEFCARNKVEHIILCDSNFGMTKQDEAFVDAFIAIRERYGYPLSFDTSWAKNKSAIFLSIVEKLKKHGLHSSFTLALQSLEPEAIANMRRQNMKLNEWQSLSQWMSDQGLDSYAELIWGIPGETTTSFFEGYNTLSLSVSRVAVYSHLVIPNTEFYNNREKYDLILAKGDRDDFNYVLCHNSMTLDENIGMHRFLFWAKIIAEHRILRSIWKPLNRLANLMPSDVLLNIDAYFQKCGDEFSQQLIAERDQVAYSLNTSKVLPALKMIYENEIFIEHLSQWWQNEIVPQLRQENRDLLTDLLRYDLTTLPLYKTAEVIGSHIEKESAEFMYDIAEFIRSNFTISQPARRTTIYTIKFRTGFKDYLNSHEIVESFLGFPVAVRFAP